MQQGPPASRRALRIVGSAETQFWVLLIGHSAFFAVQVVDFSAQVEEQVPVFALAGVTSPSFATAAVSLHLPQHSSFF